MNSTDTTTTNRLNSITTGDWIQIAALCILFLSFLAVARQIYLQNQLFKAQILKDLFEIYSKTHSPTLDEHMKDLDAYPEDYMNRIKYEREYKNNAKAIRKYIGMSRSYEYIAFCYGLKKMKLPDPLSNNWVTIEGLVREYSKQKEFRDVHEYYKSSYPEFGNFVDGVISKK